MIINYYLPSLGGVCLAWSMGGRTNGGEARGINRGQTPAPLYSAPRPLQYIKAPNSVGKTLAGNPRLKE